MSSPPIRIHVVAAFALASLAGACNPDPCIENGLEADAKYRITFQELYNEESTLAAWDPDILEAQWPACDLELATMLAPMTSFEATALYLQSLEYPNSCTSWVLEVDAFPGAGEIVGLSPGGSSLSPSYKLLASWRAEVDLSGCNAEWEVELLTSTDGDHLRALDADEPPPLLVRRWLSDWEEGCGDAVNGCVEYWVASMERVQ